MTESTSQTAPAAKAKRLTGWQKGLLAGAVLIALGGLGLQAYAYFAAPADAVDQAAEPAAPPTVPPTPTPGVVPSFLPRTDESPTPTGGQVDADADAETDAQTAWQLGDWSPAVTRLGFSFVAGFAIAYALRAFLKFALIGLGVVLLALIGLQSAGAIDVDWAAIAGRWDAVADWLARQVASLGQFVQGYLPSAASAVAGLAIGFRRR
jgi:uncharacterized membrane protein (Fun14 family)